jgi:hypothetical protein
LTVPRVAAHEGPLLGGAAPASAASRSDSASAADTAATAFLSVSSMSLSFDSCTLDAHGSGPALEAGVGGMGW